MARINFNDTTEEILGKLAGSVFQDSYFGIQIRGWNKPKNPQTQLSQLRRGNFRYLAASWRNLTSTEQDTWSSFAGSIPEGLRLFIGSNINLNLIGIDIINSYVPSSPPGEFVLDLIEATPTSFIVQASGSTTIVPDGFKLLVYATTDKQPTKIFTNPSQYSPIAYYSAGTDFTSPVDIISDWNALYGVLRPDKRICIKAALIDVTNGNKGNEIFSCIITILMADKFGVEDNNATADRQFQLNEFVFNWLMDTGAGSSFMLIKGSDSKPSVALELTNNTDTSASHELAYDSFSSSITGSTSNASINVNAASAEIRYAGSDVAQIDVDENGITLTAVNTAIKTVQEFTDNADAIANGLTDGMLYRTGDFLKIVHS